MAVLLPSQSHTYTSLFLNPLLIPCHRYRYHSLTPKPNPILLRSPTLSAHNNNLTTLQSFHHDSDSPNPKPPSSLRLAAVILFLGCFTFARPNLPPALAATLQEQIQGTTATSLKWTYIHELWTSSFKKCPHFITTK
jgi:hypothetical protein